jgi:hypothetical protein
LEVLAFSGAVINLCTIGYNAPLIRTQPCNVEARSRALEEALRKHGMFSSSTRAVHRQD